MLLTIYITGLPGLCLKKIIIVALPLCFKDVNDNEVFNGYVSGKYHTINMRRSDYLIVIIITKSKIMKLKSCFSLPHSISVIFLRLALLCFLLVVTV